MFWYTNYCQEQDNDDDDDNNNNNNKIQNLVYNMSHFIFIFKKYVGRHCEQ